MKTPAATGKLTTFKYVVKDQFGVQTKGSMKATSEATAEQQLVEQGFELLRIEAVASFFSFEEQLPTMFQIKPKEIIVFSRQLGTLLRSGITILPALEILQGQVTSTRAFRRVVGTIINDIRTGASFYQALMKHPKSFSEIYVRTIGVGEKMGDLGPVLYRMADYLEKQIALTSKIKRALTYPSIVMSAGVIIVVVMMTTVMPNLLGMFENWGVELPLATRILISLSDVMSQNPIVIAVIGGIILVIVLWLAKHPTGRLVMDTVKIRAPVIGPSTLMGELARFCRTITVLLKAGLSLQEIIHILPESTDNQVFRKSLNQVYESLLLGEGLSGPMSQIGVFPSLLVQMVAIGEESNTLDFTMEVLADFYDTSAEERTTALVSLIGPLSTALVALMVGFIALAMMLPMYSLTGTFE